MMLVSDLTPDRQNAPVAAHSATRVKPPASILAPLAVPRLLWPNLLLLQHQRLVLHAAMLGAVSCAKLLRMLKGGLAAVGGLHPRLRPRPRAICVWRRWAAVGGLHPRLRPRPRGRLRLQRRRWRFRLVGRLLPLLLLLGACCGCLLPPSVGNAGRAFWACAPCCFLEALLVLFFCFAAAIIILL